MIECKEKNGHVCRNKTVFFLISPQVIYQGLKLTRLTMRPWLPDTITKYNPAG